MIKKRESNKQLAKIAFLLAAEHKQANIIKVIIFEFSVMYKTYQII